MSISGLEQEEGVLYVGDPDFLTLENYSDDVETKYVTGLLKARDPDPGRAGELALLAPVDGAEWAAEGVGLAGFDLDERDCAADSLRISSGRDKVDVAVTVTEATLGYFPPVHEEPSFGDPLAAESHRLPRR